MLLKKLLAPLLILALVILYLTDHSTVNTGSACAIDHPDLQKLVQNATDKLSDRHGLVLEAIGGGCSEKKIRLLGLRFRTEKDPELNVMREDVISITSLVLRSIEANKPLSELFKDGQPDGKIDVAIRYTGRSNPDKESRSGACIFTPGVGIYYYERDPEHKSRKKDIYEESWEEALKKLHKEDTNEHAYNTYNSL